MVLDRRVLALDITLLKKKTPYESFTYYLNLFSFCHKI